MALEPAESVSLQVTEVLAGNKGALVSPSGRVEASRAGEQHPHAETRACSDERKGQLRGPSTCTVEMPRWDILRFSLYFRFNSRKLCEAASSLELSLCPMA